MENTISRTNFTNIEWITIPTPDSRIKYVFNEKHGLIYSIKTTAEIYITLIVKSLPNIFVVGSQITLPLLPPYIPPYVASYGDYLIVGKVSINITNGEITEDYYCGGESGEGLSLENYRDVPHYFDIWSNEEICAKCYIHTPQQIEVEHMEKKYMIDFDFNICDIVVNGKFLFITFDCKANDFETEKFAFLASLNWYTGEVNYFSAAADYIINLGDYVLITAGEDFNPNNRKIIDVPGMFYILENCNSITSLMEKISI